MAKTGPKRIWKVLAEPENALVEAPLEERPLEPPRELGTEEEDEEEARPANGELARSANAVVVFWPFWGERAAIRVVPKEHAATPDIGLILAKPVALIAPLRPATTCALDRNDRKAILCFVFCFVSEN